jgi:hypothetical protein
MPLTKKGRKIKAAMTSEYGAKKGTSVFYASINKGKVKGAEAGGKVRSGQVAHPMQHARSAGGGRWS